MLVAASPWWLADACLYSRQHFPTRYDRSLPLRQDDPSGLRYERLKQALWMATKFPPNTRVAGLSYTHHRAVAKLEPDERSTLLQRALREHLSTRALLDIVKALTVAVEAETTSPPSNLPLISLRRSSRPATAGPLVESQPWGRPHLPTRQEVRRGAEEATQPADDGSMSQIVSAAMGSLEAWERVFGRHREHPEFGSVFEPIFEAVSEVRERCHLEVA